MAELAFPLFNMALLGSFLVWAVIDYRRTAPTTTD
jgi:hypothetical protein